MNRETDAPLFAPLRALIASGHAAMTPDTVEERLDGKLNE